MCDADAGLGAWLFLLSRIPRCALALAVSLHMTQNTGACRDIRGQQ